MGIYINEIEPTFYVGNESNVSGYCEDNLVYPSSQPHDYSQDYLTFRALESGTFKLSNNALNYSLDGGTTWATLAANTASPTIASGETIMFKAQLTPSGSAGIGTFSSTGRYDVEGNIMSLLYGDNFIGQTSLSGKRYAFCKLFTGSNVVSAENLVLPATTLTGDCYNWLFNACSLLTKAPELPATTLAVYGYSGMFRFCTSLTNPPELPSTTMTQLCYNSMFEGCTSLEKAPDLPATTLVDRCYNWMFNGCTSLKYIKMLGTTIPSSSLTKWVENVSPTGTFVKSSSATIGTGINGIPSGWEVENI